MALVSSVDLCFVLIYAYIEKQNSEILGRFFLKPVLWYTRNDARISKFSDATQIHLFLPISLDLLQISALTV